MIHKKLLVSTPSIYHLAPLASYPLQPSSSNKPPTLQCGEEETQHTQGQSLNSRTTAVPVTIQTTINFTLTMKTRLENKNLLDTLSTTRNTIVAALRLTACWFSHVRSLSSCCSSCRAYRTHITIGTTLAAFFVR